MRKIVFGSLIAFIVVSAALLIERSIRVNKTVPVKSDESGKIIPADIKIKNVITGESVDFDKKFKGKVILVNYWATWCTACITEMPSLVKLYETFKDKGFEIVSINVDDDPEKVVPEAIKELHMNFPVYIETGDKPLEKIFNVVAIPYSALISKDLKIIWGESGERDWFSEPVIEAVKAELR